MSLAALALEAFEDVIKKYEKWLQVSPVQEVSSENPTPV
jgi:hypothetical protein